MGRCFDCKHGSLKLAGKLQRLGFAACKLRSLSQVVPAHLEHLCRDYAEAGPEQIAAGKEWLARLEAYEDRVRAFYANPNTPEKAA